MHTIATESQQQQPARAKRKPILLTATKRISVLHRWLGMGLCLMLALWFLTGSVLSFVPFPSLGARERLAASEDIDVGKLQVDPAEALRAAGGSFIGRFRLVSVAGRPTYLISRDRAPVMAVDGQTGEVLGAIDARAAEVIAERFLDREALRVDGPLELDQWTVHDPYEPVRPLYRVHMDDPARTIVYVSARSGEVVQRTHRFERALNYVGAVVHWINVVPLRANYGLWRRVVWTIALAGIVLVSAGLFLGIVRYVNLKRQRRHGLSPFSGWLRWHHSIGLFAGVLALSWVGSGWLSLDIGTFFSRPQPDADRIERMRGVSLLDAANAFPISLIATLGTAREIEFGAVGSQPLLMLRDRDPRPASVVLMDANRELRTAAVVPDELLLAAVQAAWPLQRIVELRRVGPDDAYSLRGAPLPATARRLVLDDPAATWVQVDAATGQIISVLDRSRRAYRWLVDGLHTFDFPLLNQHGSLWHVLLIIGTTSGFLLSCTAVVLSFKRLRRSRAERRAKK